MDSNNSADLLAFPLKHASLNKHIICAYGCVSQKKKKKKENGDVPTGQSQCHKEAII